MSKNKEIKAGVGYTIGNILIKGISFITLPIFSRILTTEDYGLFNTYMAYEAIIVIILGMGMHSSIKNAQFDFMNELDTYISTQVIIVLLTTFSLGILYGIFHLQINLFTGFSTQISGLLIMQSFGASMLNIINAKLSLSYSYKAYMKYAAFNTIANVLISIILILTVMSNSRFLGRVAGASIPLIIIGFSVLCTIWKGKPRLFDRVMARYALNYGFPLIWHFLSQQVQAQFDRIMITKLVNAASTGIYSFVYSIANIFQILFYSTDTVWSIWFFKEMKEKNYLNIWDKAKQYMLGVALVCCLMMVSSKEIIMIMGVSTYWTGASLFIPIIVGMYFLFMYTIPVGIEYFYKETKYIGATTMFAAIVNIVSNYIFISLYGYRAAAYTTAASYIIMFFLHYYISKEILRRHDDPVLFKLKDFSLYALIVVLVGILVMALNPYPIMKYTVAILVSGIMLYKNWQIILKICRELKSKRESKHLNDE